MSNFTDKLTVSKLNAHEWQVEREFTYYIGKENSNEFIVVPKGFITDFASVPRGLWNIFPPDGEYTQAAVLHDYMYSENLFARKRCDEIFLEAMVVLNVPKWKRVLMFWAVRTFGGFCWKEKKK